MAAPQIYYKDGDSWKSALLNSYPVGAIYASTSSTSPGSIFGGGWVQITGDACLMAGTSVGNVGSKTISIDQIPSHNHMENRPATVDNYHAGGTLFGSALTGAWGHTPPYLYTQSTGGGKTTCPTAIVVICGEELHKFGYDA